MDDSGAQLVRRAEAAYERAVSDPTGCEDLTGLVAQARHEGPAEALVIGLRAQAWCARHQLDAAVAKSLLDDAVRVAHRHLLDGRLVEVLATRAAVNQELGNVGAAQRDLDRARAVASSRTSADLDLQQAVLHHNSGRFGAAAALYDRLIHSPSTPIDVRVKAANNLALVEAHQGRHATALARLDGVRDAASAVGPVLVAVVEDTRGWVTVQSGRLSEGLRILGDAAQRHREAGLPLGEHYLEHCDALLDLRLLPEAMRMATLARDEFAAHGVTLLEAEAQVRVARLARLTGDHDAAISAAHAAGTMFRRQRRPAWAALSRVLEVEARIEATSVRTGDVQALHHCAQLLEDAGMVSWAVDAHLAAGSHAGRAGRSALAMQCLADAERLSREGPALQRLKGHVAGARRARELGERRLVLAHAGAGLRDLAEHRAALSSIELRALASGHGQELGRLSLRTLLEGATPGDVLQGMEQTRAAALLPTEAPLPTGSHQTGDSQALVAELRSVQGELAAARTSGGSEPPELVSRLREVEGRIRRATWTALTRQVGSRGPVPLSELRRALAGRVLVEYAVLDGELLAVVLRSRRSSLVRMGPAAAVDVESDHLTFALRRLVDPRLPEHVLTALRARAVGALDRLRRLLLHPLGLGPGEPVVVVPSAAHWRLPWAHLYQAPTSMAPSAASWVRTAQRPAPASGGVVLVAGPDLPGAGAEVAALSRLYPAARVLVPPASTVDAVIAELRGARLAHLACHGLLRVDNPTFSSFRLSSGELTVHELDMHELSPFRVVLSACHSGADATYDGEEFLGFVSTLLGRGTAGLLASGIQVSDEEVVPLVSDVHRRLLCGDPMADALHHAALEIDPERPEGLAALCSFNAYGAA